jgi:hypothetical protein
VYYFLTRQHLVYLINDNFRQKSAGHVERRFEYRRVSIEFIWTAPHHFPIAWNDRDPWRQRRPS